ncbi:hypothetical protein [Neobacillus ginsengisoli]|uniref:Uncharacterized protein n=1 Tax=Neobacillus ginsengisoli TaxID=904295 RepID=A0ABT9Y279_9BACI|nr:hypothetical protein [Neobacillus ginsengisoli]MDQ0201919.1 hypothetical protein [Neobacillus ginsengisoli]
MKLRLFFWKTVRAAKMVTNVALKQNWSNRVQIKIIRLARTIWSGEGTST